MRPEPRGPVAVGHIQNDRSNVHHRHIVPHATDIRDSAEAAPAVSHQAFLIRPHGGRTEKGRTMPIIRVEMFAGRSREQKAALAKRMTEAFLDTCGRPGQGPDGVWVLIEEMPPENWAVGGELGGSQ
nr:4-oxalocrotonate tautomerase family protein [Actinopolymorpha rutila]